MHAFSSSPKCCASFPFFLAVRARSHFLVLEYRSVLSEVRGFELVARRCGGQLRDRAAAHHAACASRGHGDGGGAPGLLGRKVLPGFLLGRRGFVC